MDVFHNFKLGPWIIFFLQRLQVDAYRVQSATLFIVKAFLSYILLKLITKRHKLQQRESLTNF